MGHTFDAREIVAPLSTKHSKQRLIKAMFLPPKDQRLQYKRRRVNSISKPAPPSIAEERTIEERETIIVNKPP